VRFSKVDALSDPRERAERELDLQMALGPFLYATKSYSHPDVGRTYARALELCRQLGDDPREVTALRGLYLHHNNLLEMEKALHFAEEALRVAERLTGPGSRASRKSASAITGIARRDGNPANPGTACSDRIDNPCGSTKKAAHIQWLGDPLDTRPEMSIGVRHFCRSPTVPQGGSNC
jgi:hypothetical protein